ncbi:hypothetical protein BACI348_41961 [Bacillus altitudinis]|uniref:Uncharacterized protein n=1 Tax=Bacillus altitudinis TaxID=293387 RepID=A0A653V6Z8_BACAB|nr:hypothetical protein BACI348_41961 [Bacillus altitudinis]
MNEGTIYIAVPPCLKDKTTRLFTYTDNGQIRSFTNQATCMLLFVKAVREGNSNISLY